MTTGRGLLAALVLAVTLSPVHAAMVASETAWDGSEPPQGIYFHWYEPSFYTGFAPRTQDPSRLHIRLSRGNQVRVTLVLGDAELDAYLDDLLLRRRTYQELVDARVIELTTNTELERFGARLDEADVAAVVASRSQLGAEGYRRRSVEIMSALNPARVFRIHFPLGDLLARWHALLMDGGGGRLDLANAIVPGRVNLTELVPEVDAALGRALEAARTAPPTAPAFRDAALAFLSRATGGHYGVRDGAIEAVEFTAIYPAGTIEAMTEYKGERLPDFGVTGVWPLIRRTQGRGILGMVDYLSPNPGYGFISMFAYQYAGGIAYNAFHNAGVRCGLGETPFLPSAWRKVMGERSPTKPYQNLWIASRGPTSHGCTRLGSGHMSELRQIAPSASPVLERVVSFRNLPQCYDVFDIDGDGRPEVMGVQYYQAFRSTEHTPVAAYVTNRRAPFYAWLYGTNVQMGPVGQARLREVPVCRFVGRKAEEARTERDLPLYEAPWAIETIQFYRVKPAPFDGPAGFELNRELRKVGAGHTLDRGKLLLR
ncbi:MAG: hypothetical protein U0807_17620 [Candidatus Binatia bacterium]